MSIKSSIKKLFGKTPEVGESVTLGIWDIIIDDICAYNRHGDLLKGFNKITFYTDDKRIESSLVSDVHATAFIKHFKKRMEEERIAALDSLILGVTKGWYSVLPLKCAPNGARKVNNLEEPCLYNVGFRSVKSTLTIKEVDSDKEDDKLWSACLSREKLPSGMFRLGRYTGDPSYRKNEVLFPQTWTDISRHQCTVLERGGEWLICADCEWPVVYLEREPVEKDKYVSIPKDCELQLGHRRRFVIKIDNESHEE